MRLTGLLLLASLLSAAPAQVTISTRTATMRAMPGLLPLYWDGTAGKLYLEVPVDAAGRSVDLLYVHSLPFGTGSNDLGLDRGQLGGVGETGGSRIVHFERMGPKVLLIEPNQRFRSSATDAAERAAVRESFPEAVLAGFKVEAESPAAVLVDATEFFLRDAHGVIDRLSQAKQGSYKVDAARSAIALDRTKAFPRNTEVEAMLTFTSDAPAARSFVSDLTSDAHTLTLREHQTFMALPGPGFRPRRFDPRSGYFPESYRDYTVPLGGELEQQFILRHRLNKKDPRCRTACVAEAPIQYYVDRGAPEPIRTALVEGTRWWDQAFQAAGWAAGTFKVDVLPEGADPMDVRFNMIQWVHRYTRGWSYGAAMADPRTGEIVKGNVTLGSLRGRQDYLIAEALLSPYVQGAKAFTPENDPMLRMVLARIRQLAAHEVGHTLGLAHNFAASATSQGTSVMDYPHPYVTVGADGVPDLSRAYAVGIGAWDKVAIEYGYREFATGSDERVGLDRVLEDARKTGMIFITDEDARPAGGAHPHAHLWDNGPDAAAELERVLGVRAAALARFGENAIKPGMPVARMEDALVPLYLLHRYQAEAAVKVIGGLDYRYQVRGDGQAGPRIVDPAEQARALAAVLKTLTPEVLTLPERLLAVMPPRPPGLARTRESFASETGLTFDPVAAAESAADLTLGLLFDPARASRLVQYHMRLGGSLSLRGVLEAVSKTVAERPEGGHTMSSEVERAVEFRALEGMLGLAVNPAASSQARAIARSHVGDLLAEMKAAAPLSDTAEAIHRKALIGRIEEFERGPEKFVPAKAVEAPPGMPIGEDEDDL